MCDLDEIGWETQPSQVAIKIDVNSTVRVSSNLGDFLNERAEGSVASSPDQSAQKLQVKQLPKLGLVLSPRAQPDSAHIQALPKTSDLAKEQNRSL